MTQTYLAVKRFKSNSTDFFCLTQPHFWSNSPRFLSNSEFRRVTRRNRRKITEKITLTIYVADYKALNMLCGQQGHSCTWPCPFCYSFKLRGANGMFE